MRVELVDGPLAGRLVEVPDVMKASHILADPQSGDVVAGSDYEALQRIQGRHWAVYAARRGEDDRLYYLPVSPWLIHP